MGVRGGGWNLERSYGSSIRGAEAKELLGFWVGFGTLVRHTSTRRISSQKEADKSLNIVSSGRQSLASSENCIFMRIQKGMEVFRG